MGGFSRSACERQHNRGQVRAGGMSGDASVNEAKLQAERRANFDALLSEDGSMTKAQWRAVYLERMDELEASLRQAIDTDSIYRLAATFMMAAQAASRVMHVLSESQTPWPPLGVSLKNSTNAELSAINAFRDSLYSALAKSGRAGVVGSERFAKKLRAKGGRARWEADPLAPEKLLIKSCWDDWQSQPAKYSNKSEFARDMLAKCEHLTSEKKITDWCREWGKLPLS